MVSASNPSVVLGYEISQDDDSQSLPQKIIFREITIVADGTNLDIVYTNYDEKIFVDDIDAFILSKSEYPETIEPGRPLNTSPLDLNCKDDCYIVFYLSSNWNWQFSSSGRCFTTKRSLGSKYCNLTYVMEGGEEVPGSTFGRDECRLLYFRAKCTPDYPDGFDGFNLRVQLNLPDGDRTTLIIDPDIRNPGGSGS